MMNYLRLTFLITILVGFSTAAEAESKKTAIDRGTEHWGKRKWAFQLRLSPLGLKPSSSAGPADFLAIGLDYSPSPYLSITGEGAITPSHFGIMPRLRLPLVKQGIYLGSGVSYGSGYMARLFGGAPYRTVWSNTEVGYEYQSSRAFGLRAYGGYSYGFNQSDFCNEGLCSRVRDAFFGGIIWSWRFKTSRPTGKTTRRQTTSLTRASLTCPGAS